MSGHETLALEEQTAHRDLLELDNYLDEVYRPRFDAYEEAAHSLEPAVVDADTKRISDLTDAREVAAKIYTESHPGEHSLSDEVGEIMADYDERVAKLEQPKARYGFMAARGLGRVMNLFGRGRTFNAVTGAAEAFKNRFTLRREERSYGLRHQIEDQADPSKAAQRNFMRRHYASIRNRRIRQLVPDADQHDFEQAIKVSDSETSRVESVARRRKHLPVRGMAHRAGRRSGQRMVEELKARQQLPEKQRSSSHAEDDEFTLAA